MQRIFLTLFLIGFALLPFSNQTKDQTWNVLFSIQLPFIEGLYSPGLIILWFASVAGFFSWFQRGAPSTASARGYIALAASYVGVIFCLLPVVPDLKASSIRATSNLLGFMLYALLLLRDRRQVTAAQSYIQSNLGLLALATTGVILSLYYLTNTVVQTSFSSLESIIYSRFMGGVNSLSWGASNIVASVLLISVSAAVLLFNAIGGSGKILTVICVISAGILSTLSRNSLICLTLIVIVYALVLGRRKLLWIVGLIIFLSATGEFLRQQNLLDEIVESRTSDLRNVVSVGGRQEIWGHYVDKLVERPLGFNGLYSSLSEFGFSPHNWFLTTYWELGFVGVAVGLALIFLPLIKIWKEQKRGNRRISRAGLLAICIALIIFLNVQSEDPQFSHQYIVSWWVWLAAVLREVSDEEPLPRNRILPAVAVRRP